MRQDERIEDVRDNVVRLDLSDSTKLDTFALFDAEWDLDELQEPANDRGPDVRIAPPSRPSPAALAAALQASEEPPAAAAAAPTEAAPVPEEPDTTPKARLFPRLDAHFAGIAAAAGWAGAAVGAPIGYWGAETLAAQHPAILAALGVAAVAPAVSMIIGARAAKHAAEARSAASRLEGRTAIGAPDAGLNASTSATVEAFAGKVVSEISRIENVVDRALERMQILEQATARNRMAFDRILSDADLTAEALKSTFTRELDQIEALNTELREQTEQIGQSMGRQVRLIREASRMVSTEMSAAEATFEHNLTRFHDAAGRIADTTSAFNSAAGAAQTIATSLDASINNGVHQLQKARVLTEHTRNAVDAVARTAHEAADSVAATAERLEMVEAATTDNRDAFARILADSESATAALRATFGEEIGQMEALNQDLRAQTAGLSESVGRQLRMMRDAARATDQQVRQTEAALEQSLSSMNGVVTQVAERTNGFQSAAVTAYAAAGALDETMAKALDQLAHATSVTDASRQAVEAAAVAAGETAGALRETTQRAISEARRAAQAIRAESATMHEQAGAAFTKLQEAATASREASEAANLAAERQATAIQRRLAGIAEGARSGARQEQRPEPRIEFRPEPRREAAPASHGATYAEPHKRAVQAAQPAPAAAARPARQVWAAAPASAEPSMTTAETMRTTALALLEEAGINLHETLGETAYARIAARARISAQARRRAVREAAPDAVDVLAHHLAVSEDARFAAAHIRRRFAAQLDMIGQEGVVVGDEEVAALLIDGAMG